MQEKDGIPQPESIGKESVAQIIQSRKRQPSAEELISGILKGDKTALSRAITLVESTNSKHLEKANQVIQACLPYANLMSMQK